jgi:energy-converting hydrogenase Eha subunit E
VKLWREVPFALPLLPTLVPLSVVLLEPRAARPRVVPFVLLGAVVSSYLGAVLYTDPVGVVMQPHALQYQTGIDNGGMWVMLHIIAVIGPALSSGYRSIIAFGDLNLVGLALVAVLYVEAFASLWCVYAAAASVLVLVHMVRRRRLSDRHGPAQSAIDLESAAATPKAN